VVETGGLEAVVEVLVPLPHLLVERNPEPGKIRYGTDANTRSAFSVVIPDATASSE
jgi:hypothetical protein